MLVLQIDNVWREVAPDPIPELPEFRISPRAPRAVLAKENVQRPAPHQGPLYCIPQKVRTNTGPGKADPIWDTALGLKLFKEQPAEKRVPWGTVPFYPGLSTFVNEQAELAWLIATQELDPPTVTQELRELGWSSSSQIADDDAWERIGMRHKGAPILASNGDENAGEEELVDSWDPEAQARKISSIDFERYTMSCGPVVAVRLEPSKKNPGRYRAVESNRTKILTEEQVSHIGAYLLERLGDEFDLSPDQLDQQRKYDTYYKVRVADLAEGATRFDHYLYMSPTTEENPEHHDWLPEEWTLEAEQEKSELARQAAAIAYDFNIEGDAELLLHNIDEDMHQALPEPQPWELWPLDYPIGVEWSLETGLVFEPLRRVGK